MARGQLGGRAFMVTAKSGHGKTTIARLSAAEVAEEFSISEFDAADLTAAAMEDHCVNPLLDSILTQSGGSSRLRAVNPCWTTSHEISLSTTQVDGRLIWPRHQFLFWKRFLRVSA
jgi:hypothetical protein